MSDDDKKFEDLLIESLNSTDLDKILNEKNSLNAKDEQNDDFEETLISLESLIDKDYPVEFRKSGVRDKTFRELKQINSLNRVYSTIDLHQYKSTLEGLNALNIFFKHESSKFKFLKIIHGKGLHNKDSKSPMRAMVRKYLINTDKVLAYAPAEKNDGYDGATYVLIKN
tara:strand:- start:610 stop:1116 length:507 start_codon:yes stop_codon:yes gene_type:complete